MKFIIFFILLMLALTGDIGGIIIFIVVAIYFWLTKDKGGDGRPPMMRH